MPVKRSSKLYIDDIVRSIGRIEKYAHGLSFDQFSKDEKTIDAIIRNLEIIGEAARNIPQSVREKNRNMPWKEMVGMRNKVIHEYFGVDPEILWQTVRSDMPVLKEKMKKLKK